MEKKLTLFIVLMFFFLIFIGHKAYLQEKENNYKKSLSIKQKEEKELKIETVKFFFKLNDSNIDSFILKGNFNKDKKTILKEFFYEEGLKFSKKDTLYKEKIFDNVSKKYIFMI
jgi:Fe-S cluster biosynthesis and repair protein YggX